MRSSTRERWRQLDALEGLIPEEVGSRLAYLAGEVLPEHAIVELGSYKGKSTCYLAEGSRLGNGARVYAVEAWDLEGHNDGKYQFAHTETRRAFESQLRTVGLRSRVTVKQSFTVDAAAKWKGPKVGLLYVDADHLYESVRADFEAWQPHLAWGATVVFDDYATSRNPGVKRYCDELRQQTILVEWCYEPPRLAQARWMP